MRAEPWTPGPWHVDANLDAAPEPWIVVDAEHTPQAFVHENENARLIALAPEMAELLEWFSATEMTEVEFQSQEWPYILRARDLLARARGHR